MKAFLPKFWLFFKTISLFSSPTANFPPFPSYLYLFMWNCITHFCLTPKNVKTTYTVPLRHVMDIMVVFMCSLSCCYSRQWCGQHCTAHLSSKRNQVAISSAADQSTFGGDQLLNFIMRQAHCFTPSTPYHMWNVHKLSITDKKWIKLVMIVKQLLNIDATVKKCIKLVMAIKKFFNQGIKVKLIIKETHWQ